MLLLGTGRNGTHARTTSVVATQVAVSNAAVTINITRPQARQGNAAKEEPTGAEPQYYLG
jgi:hypothetical protein